MTSEVIKGHIRSILKFQNHIILWYIFCLTPDLLKTFQDCQHYEDVNFFIKWSITSKVIQRHIRPLLCQIHFSIFVYGLILMKICINANIMKALFFHSNHIWPEMSLYVIEKFFDLFTLRPPDLITTLT